MEPIKVLDDESSIVSEYRKLGSTIPSNFLAFYHGGINAIIMQRDLMLIHFFDRQVHRGYAVFDTCNMFNQRLYLFDEHMSRFFNSMKLANLKPPHTPSEIKMILSQIAVVLGRKSLNFRYWCSRGSKNLDITTGNDEPCVLYVIAMSGNPVVVGKGMQNAFTVSTEVKGPILAEMKSTNYLLNSLAADEAVKKNCIGIMITEEGYVTESPVQAVAYVLKDGTYYAPPYYRALRSISQDRVIKLIQKYLLGKTVKRISRERMTVNELKEKAVEMILLGGERIIPIRCWDDVIISDTIGPVTKEIINLLEKDYTNPEVAHKIITTKL